MNLNETVAANSICLEKIKDLEDFCKISKSVSNSYSAEWELLFYRHDYMDYLRSYAIRGLLRSCRFRSVCWRLYLGVLPVQHDSWLESTQEKRSFYADLKSKFITNVPDDINDNIPANMSSLPNGEPLDEEQGKRSPWNMLLADAELRRTIKQDVVRTYPKIEFFHTEMIHNMMIDVLFIYAKLNPHIQYRQGMHELLAPIIFVLHCDHMSFEHASEMEQTKVLVKCLLDQSYIEHDSFTMFCQIMDIVQCWYVAAEGHVAPPSTPRTPLICNDTAGESEKGNLQDQSSVDESSQAKRGMLLQQQHLQITQSLQPNAHSPKISRQSESLQPASNISDSKQSPVNSPKQTKRSSIFGRGSDFGTANTVVKKLFHIHDSILRQHDPVLCNHLESMDIAPQIYGVRWLRLLFGREFPLQDLLVVWDAIFSDGNNFNLVDYVFVAMVLYMRDLLLQNEYTDVLSALMRYPRVGDVNVFIQQALHLREPQKYSPPQNFAYNSVRPNVLLQRPARPLRSVSATTPSKLTRRPDSNLAAEVSDAFSNLASTLTKKFTSPNLNLPFQKKDGQSLSQPTLAPASTPRSTGSAESSRSSSFTVSACNSATPHLQTPTAYAQHDSNPSSPLASPAPQVNGSAVIDTGSEVPTAPQSSPNPPRPQRRTTNLLDSVVQRLDKMGLDAPGVAERELAASVLKVQELEQQVALLDEKVNNFEQMSTYCAGRLSIQIACLEVEMERSDGAVDKDELFGTISTLKQVEDILCGRIRFSRSFQNSTDLAAAIMATSYSPPEPSQPRSLGSFASGSSPRISIQSDDSSDEETDRNSFSNPQSVKSLSYSQSPRTTLENVME